MAQPETESTPDAQLELKKRARRRLVGAAALALLAVIILPMVMDHEPRPTTQDVQVRIPSQETGGLAKVLPNRAATPLPPAPPDSDEDDKSDGKTEKPGAPATAKESAAESPKPVADIPRDSKADAKAQTKPQDGGKDATKDAAKDAAKDRPKPVEPAPKPADKPKADADKQPAKPAANAASKDEEARARAALLGREVEEPWLILIGAYRDKANVQQLTTKLKQAGVPTITEPYDSPQGPRTRVRAGPFKNREAAEQALAKMKKLGVDGVVKQSGK